MISDERYKQLMNKLGQPQSKSLLQALQQVAMESALDERESCAKKCDVDLKSLYLSQGRSVQEEAMLVAAVDDCAMAIRNR